MSRQALRHPDRHAQKVAIGYCHPGEVSGDFCGSLMTTILANPNLVQGVIAQRSGPRVAEARNLIIQQFFKADALQDTPWLWFVDADMTFPPDTLPRLLAAADARSRPIVGGLCFAGGDGHPVYPTLYRLTEEGEYEAIADYPEGLVKVDATGAACLLIHQSALVTIGEAFNTMPNGNPSAYPWFVEGVTTKSGRPMGEDIALCSRANVCGIPIHVDTRVKIGHRKPQTVDESMFLAQREEVECVAGPSVPVSA